MAMKGDFTRPPASLFAPAVSVVGEGSGRNGGQCNNGTAHDYAGLAAQRGADTAKAMMSRVRENS
jgi:hypothetical protein